MIINYNIAKLQAALNDFYTATGVYISLSDLHFQYVVTATAHTQGFCEHWKENGGQSACRVADETLFRLCEQSREMQIHRCPAGLVDICIPVQKNGALLGYLILGRLREYDELPVTTGLSNVERARELYRALPLYTKERALAVSNLATILTTYILTEDLILAKKSEEVERLTAYIDENLEGDLCVERICRDIHLSKTGLYRLFSEHMGCGVNQYITARRMETARALLLHTDFPVSEICTRVGISNYGYFCRLFKKRNGISPLQYRKQK
jgi:AraC-like DNA-binding protein